MRKRYKNIVLLLTILCVNDNKNGHFLVATQTASTIAAELGTVTGSLFFVMQAQHKQALLELTHQQQELERQQREFHEQMKTLEKSLTQEGRRQFENSHYRELLEWDLCVGAFKSNPTNTTSTISEKEQSTTLDFSPHGQTIRMKIEAQPNGFITLANRIAEHVSIGIRTTPSSLEFKEIEHQVHTIEQWSRQQTAQRILFDEQVAQHFGCTPLKKQYERYLDNFVADVLDILKEPYGTERVLKIYNLATTYSARAQFENDYNITNLSQIPPELKQYLVTKDGLVVSKIHVTDQLFYENKREVIEALLRTCTNKSGTITTHTRNLKTYEEESILAALESFVDQCVTDENMVQLNLSNWDQNTHDNMIQRLMFGKRYERVYTDLLGKNLNVHIETLDVSRFASHPYNTTFLKSMNAVDQGCLSLAHKEIETSSLSLKEKKLLFHDVDSYAHHIITKIFDSKCPDAYIKEGSYRHVMRDPLWQSLSLDVQLAYAHDPTMAQILVNRHELALQLQNEFNIPHHEKKALSYIYAMLDSVTSKNHELIEPILPLLKEKPDNSVRRLYFNEQGLCRLFETSSSITHCPFRSLVDHEHSYELLTTANRLLSYGRKVEQVAVQEGLLLLSYASNASTQKEYHAYMHGASLCLEHLRNNEQYPAYVPSSELVKMTEREEITSFEDVCQKAIDIGEHNKLIEFHKKEVVQLEEKLRLLSSVEDQSLNWYEAASRAYNYVGIAQSSLDYYEQVLARQCASDIINGLEGNEEYLPLVETKFENDKDFEDAYSEWHVNNFREPKKEFPRPPIGPYEEKDIPYYYEPTKEEIEKAEKLTEEMFDFCKRNKVDVKNTTMKPKDIQHIKHGEYDVKKGIFRGGHLDPQYQGKPLEVLGKKAIDRFGSTKGTPASPLFKYLKPKSMFPKDYPMTSLLEDASRACRTDNLQVLAQKGVINRFRFLTRNGVLVEFKVYSNSMTMYPVSQPIELIDPLLITQAAYPSQRKKEEVGVR